MEAVELIEQPDLPAIGLHDKKPELRSFRLDGLDLQREEAFAAHDTDKFYLIISVNCNFVRN